MSEDKDKQQSGSENKPASGHKRSTPGGSVDKVQNIGDFINERRAAELTPRPPKTGDANKKKDD